MKNEQKRAFAFACAVLFLSLTLQAEESCPVEVKLLLSPPTIQTAITSLSFEKQTRKRIYFFDTDALELFKQGVIVRLRQGADNDLTVKVRAPRGSGQVDNSHLRKHFPCEIDRTGDEENTSYAVRRKYKTPQIPEKGSDISNLLTRRQEGLLREAGAVIDWARVMRIAAIQSTQWETTAQAPFRKLALELWEFPAGSILEISTRVSPDAEPAKYAEFQRMADGKGLSLQPDQRTKTEAALEAFTHPTSTLK